MMLLGSRSISFLVVVCGPSLSQKVPAISQQVPRWKTNRESTICLKKNKRGKDRLLFWVEIIPGSGFEPRYGSGRVVCGELIDRDGTGNYRHGNKVGFPAIVPRVSITRGMLNVARSPPGTGKERNKSRRMEYKGVHRRSEPLTISTNYTTMNTRERQRQHRE